MTNIPVKGRLRGKLRRYRKYAALVCACPTCGKPLVDLPSGDFGCIDFPRCRTTVAAAAISALAKRNEQATVQTVDE